MKRQTRKTDDEAQNHDAGISAIEKFARAPEAAKNKIVEDAKASLKQDAEDAVKILAEVRELVNAFAPERMRLEQIAWGRLILSGFSSRDCGTIERLLVELRDVRLEGLENVPRRIDNLTAEQVRTHIPADIKWVVKVSRPLPEDIRTKIETVRALVASVGAKVAARRSNQKLVDVVQIQGDDADARSKNAATDFDPYNYENGERA